MKNIIVILIFLFGNMFAQDSLKFFAKTNFSIDSTSTSPLSEKIDTIKSKGFDIEDIVYTSAKDSLHFKLSSKKMFIYGNGNLKYKETELKGGKIDVNFLTNQLEAEGTFEVEDSTGTEIITQTPVLTEGAESYEGTKLKYNFKTQQGFISAAKNSKEGSRYEGSAVKKVDRNTFFIKDGIYTTCVGDTPHTYFSASEMKVIQKDKIFAKWIFMHVGGVPLPLPIPFAVFPNETGRRSGIITPSYGTTANRGQFFKNFGFFFAISEYMDLALTGDYYTRGGYGLRGRYRYSKKYNYNGSINAGYSNIEIGEDDDPNPIRQADWNLALNHNQNFTPTMNLSGSIRLGSPTFLQNNSVSYSDLLVKDINSQFTLTKRWDESKTSLNISYSRSQNVSTGNVREILPNLTFTKSQSYPFKKKGRSSRDQEWYEYIGYSYNGQFRNTRNKDSTGLKIRGGVQHNISINASPKIGHFNISPRLNYVEKWYNKKKSQSYISLNNIVQKGATFLPSSHNFINAIKDSLIESDISEINMLRTFNFSLSASTKLYGMMQPKTLGVEAIRHTLTPGISYNYTPDFSNRSWDYYETVKRADGTFDTYDPYTGEVFGGVGSGETQGLNFSLGNVFEMKTMQDMTDTTSESQKISLLNLSISSGYNFAADSLRMSDLRLSYRTKIGQFLNFQGSSGYTVYDYNNSEDTRRVNKYLASEGKGLFRLTNLNFSISTSISGDKLKGEDRKGKKEKEENDYSLKNKRDFIDLYDEEDNDFSIPWNLSLTYNYNLNKPTPNEHTINSNIG
ncbi:MAG: putative LPS assembly protein LptD, partial [Melioribacteraceae bacterium]